MATFFDAQANASHVEIRRFEHDEYQPEFKLPLLCCKNQPPVLVSGENSLDANCLMSTDRGIKPSFYTHNSLKICLLKCQTFDLLNAFSEQIGIYDPN